MKVRQWRGRQTKLGEMHILNVNLTKIKNITLSITGLKICFCSKSGESESVINKFDSILHSIDKASYVGKSLMD